jgi:hypothetical protein
MSHLFKFLCLPLLASSLLACQNKETTPLFVDSPLATEIWDRWEEENEEKQKSDEKSIISSIEKIQREIEEIPFEK